MSKKALVAQISSRFESEAAAERAIDAVVDGVLAEVAGGGMVVLRGFGTFKRKERKARMGRNPSTGAAIPIAAKTVLVFETKTTF